MVTAAAPSYSHATEPRAVANRSKFRAPEGADGQASNIMFDRRVVRGSTYVQTAGGSRIIAPHLWSLLFSASALR